MLFLRLCGIFSQSRLPRFNLRTWPHIIRIASVFLRIRCLVKRAKKQRNKLDSFCKNKNTVFKIPAKSRPSTSTYPELYLSCSRTNGRKAYFLRRPASGKQVQITRGATGISQDVRWDFVFLECHSEVGQGKYTLELWLGAYFKFKNRSCLPEMLYRGHDNLPLQDKCQNSTWD